MGPRADNKARNIPYSHCLTSHTKTKLHSCNIHAEGLGQSQADSLVVGALLVSPCELKLVSSAGFLVVPLTPLGPTILSHNFYLKYRFIF